MPTPTLIQLVARLEHQSGLTADTVENVLHVWMPDTPSGANRTSLMNAVRDFYITIHGAQTKIIGAYMSDSLNRLANKCHVLEYETTDFSGATPFGAPFAQIDFTLTAAGAGDPMPEEIACVVSYAGDLSGVPVSQTNPSPPPATIRPQQRRRGRMFVGPLNTGVGVTGSTFWRPSATFRTDLGLAFKGMANTINAVAGATAVFSVWSRADSAVHVVQTGYVDDAWDVQRRRGAQVTVRTAFTIP